MKYTNTTQVTEEVCNYLNRLLFEYNGYLTLIREFTVEVPDQVEFKLDDKQYDKLVNEYHQSFDSLMIAIKEVLKTNNVGEFYIDDTTSTIHWNEADNV